MTQPAKQSDTRTALLNTAADLIWMHNYGSVSVDDICRKAGAQKGSFYHFFPSKSDLAKAAMENMWLQMRPGLDHIFSPQVPGLERLRHYADFTLKQQHEDTARLGLVAGCPFTTLGSERCSGDDGITALAWEILLRVRKYFVIALRDAHEEGAVKTNRSALIAGEIFTHYLGALAISRLCGSLEPMANLFERWSAIIEGYER